MDYGHNRMYEEHNEISIKIKVLIIVGKSTLA